jgi:hypothetical protein
MSTKGRTWTLSEEALKNHKGFTKENHPDRSGVKLSNETRMKMSMVAKGVKKTPEHRKNISISKRGHRSVWGERCWNWKGGISKIDKLCRGMREYYEWRSAVFERDNWTCQTCGARGIYLTAHHIHGFSLIIKENNVVTLDDARNCEQLWNIDNGVTLCEKCHSLTDNYKYLARK